jgi:hypothetical protein
LLRDRRGVHGEESVHEPQGHVLVPFAMPDLQIYESYVLKVYCDNPPELLYVRPFKLDDVEMAHRSAVNVPLRAHRINNRVRCVICDNSPWEGAYIDPFCGHCISYPTRVPTEDPTSVPDLGNTTALAYRAETDEAFLTSLRKATTCSAFAKGLKFQLDFNIDDEGILERSLKKSGSHTDNHLSTKYDRELRKSFKNACKKGIIASFKDIEERIDKDFAFRMSLCDNLINASSKRIPGRFLRSKLCRLAYAIAKGRGELNEMGLAPMVISTAEAALDSLLEEAAADEEGEMDSPEALPIGAASSSSAGP